MILAGVLAFVSFPAIAADEVHGAAEAVHEEHHAGDAGDVDFGTGAHDEDALHGEHGADGHGDGHAEEHVDGLPQLNFSTYSPQIFWLVVIFLAMYIALSKKSLPDISSTIENRKNHIDADLSTAEKLQEEAEAVQHAYEASLDGARDKASETIADVEQAIKSQGASELDAFQKRAEKEIMDIEARIETAKAEAMNNMNDIATEVAADAVQKIIGVNPDAQKAKAIVESLTGKSKAKAA